MRRPRGLRVLVYQSTRPAVFLVKSGPSRGGLAQLGERLLCKQDVRGSSPLSSTKFSCVHSGQMGNKMFRTHRLHLVCSEWVSQGLEAFLVEVDVAEVVVHE